MEGPGRQVYNLYEQLRSRGSVRLELWCGIDCREYFTLSNHPPGPPPPSPVIKRRRRRHRRTRKSSPELSNEKFNGRAAQAPSNGRGAGALPLTHQDVTEPPWNGQEVRDIAQDIAPRRPRKQTVSPSLNNETLGPLEDFRERSEPLLTLQEQTLPTHPSWMVQTQIPTMSAIHTLDMF